MNKISILTTYIVEDIRGDEVKYAASTVNKTYSSTEELQGIIDMHNEKVAANERKVIKSHE